MSATAQRKRSSKKSRSNKQPARRWAVSRSDWKNRITILVQRPLFWGGVAAFCLSFAGIGFVYLLAPNVRQLDRPTYLYIPTDATYEQVLDSLRLHQYLKSPHTFSVVSMLVGYPLSVQAGRYRLESGMSNLKLLFKLRNGLQEPVNLTFTATRTASRLAEKLARQLEPTAEEFEKAFADTNLLAELGLTRETLMTNFIPNTYSIYWNTPATEVLRRMKLEWNRFWTAERLRQADSLKLTPIEISILASIVEAETSRDDERARIAGLYLNRLRNGWLLQADPTLIFAWQDFGIRRVLKKHKEIDSPYNTYMYPGLPPGPINCPSIASIEAVLQPESHNYFFMVARPDFDGYHNFYGEDQYRQHVNAGNRYRRKLDQLNIRN